MTSLSVIKRNNSVEAFSRDEIKNDIAFFLTENIKLEEILDELQNGLVDKIKTTQISELLSSICASYISKHPDHNKLAAAICIMKLHKETSSSYIETMTKLYKNDPQLISEKAYNNALKYEDQIENAIDYNRDFLIDFFGLKTLERSYLKKIHSKTLEDFGFGDSESKGRKEPLGHNNEELRYVHTSTIIERPQHLWMTVSLGIHGDDIEKALECYDYMSRLYMVHATPTLFNSNTNREQLSSCFILGIQDNIENIFKVVGDMAKISKYAGGIGVALSRIRAKNSIIRGTNGTSDGVVPLCVMLNKLARYINQGGKRNGSIAAYSEPWHADIFDFVELRKNTGDENSRARDLFLALWVNDIFMKRVEADEMWSLMCPDECPGLVDTYGEEFESLYTKYESEGKYKKRVKAKELWFHILDAQCETGMPYMCYKDNVNKKTNHQNVGVINSSNLCVAPETKILTEDGIYEIKDLNDKEVKVWNGEKWSQTKVVKTGENQKLLKITLSNGAVLETTPYHKFIIRESYTDKKPLIKATRVEAKDLKVGMKLAKSEQVIVKGDEKNDIKYPYTHGFFCGDGTYNINKYSKTPVLSLYGEKKDLLPYLEINSTSGIPDASGRLNTTLHKDIAEKFLVPMNASLDCRLRWLEGLFDADGCVCRNGTNQALQLSSTEKEFLQNIRIMLGGMGVNAKVTKMFEEKQKLLPDGKGGKKMFDCKPSWRVLISSSGLKTLYDMGFRPKRLKIEDHNPQRNAEQFTQVVSVEDTGRSDDTYCFNEPENNAGVFNGVLAGNCAEINEYYNENEYAVCNLASICLPKFVIKKEDNTYDFNFNELLKVAKILTTNLNNIIDINFYPVEETKTSNFKMRPIGVGVQGLTDCYQMMKLPYNSEKARTFNKQIFETIYYGCLSRSCELAKEKKPYDRFEGSPYSKGQFQFHMWGLTEDDMTSPIIGKEKWLQLKEDVMKFGTISSLHTCVMPTASTSQIQGNTESTEVKTSNLYMRKTISGEFIVINEYLVKHLEELGLWNDQIRNEIIYDQGSIQNIEEIPIEVREIYKTAFEVKQRDIVTQSIERGRFLDQAESLNLFMKEPDFNKLSSSHFYGWKHGIKTGMYYLRTQPASSAIPFGLDATILKIIKDKRISSGVEQYKECSMVRKSDGTYQICESCT